MDVGRAGKLLELAVQVSALEMRKCVVNYIAAYIEEVSETDGYKKCVATNAEVVNEVMSAVVRRSNKRQRTSSLSAEAKELEDDDGNETEPYDREEEAEEE